ncbi:MAG: pyrimidine 5'-nucleotidase [Anaerolineaceae bacterium]|nr:pyrimidine 5'-nucleotidase [Anaerolineaceae bacterium]
MRYSTLFFDLDDTLYPADSGLWPVMLERISLYMHEKLGLSWQEIPSLRKHLNQTYGTSLRGLKQLYQIDEHDYLQFVHDVPLSNFIQPNRYLRKIIESYPQRKFIFTNADSDHAARVIKVLELEGCFEKIIDIHTISPYCKPLTPAYQLAMQAAGESDPRKCVLIDDTLINVAKARRLGFYAIRVGEDDSPAQYDACIPRLSEILSVLPKEEEQV